MKVFRTLIATALAVIITIGGASLVLGGNFRQEMRNQNAEIFCRFDECLFDECLFEQCPRLEGGEFGRCGNNGQQGQRQGGCQQLGGNTLHIQF